MKNTIRQDTKIFSILKHFASGKRLHRFEAERLGDHCLHTTVAGITRAHGISFQKEWIKVPTNYGKPVRVIRYWLEGDSLEKAIMLVGGYIEPQIKKPAQVITETDSL